MKSRLKNLLAEPLLHFLAIGAVLYGLSAVLAPEARNPNTIAVGDAEYRHMAELFQKERERLPTRAEMDRMVDLYVKSETLAREATALGLDDGDEMIRERLAQRMRFMMYSSIEVPVPSDDDLKAWLEKDPDRYTTRPTLSIQIIGLDASQEDAAAMAEKARKRDAEGNPITSTEVYLVTFKNRARNQLERLFGKDFIAAIEKLPEGEWQPLNSPRGWQAAKLIGSTPAKSRSFEDVVFQARQDWQEEERQARARAALADLQRRYPVERGPDEPYILPEGTDTEGGNTAQATN